MERIPKFHVKTLFNIYNNIYGNVIRDEHIVFLCGAKTENSVSTMRDILRSTFENDTRKFKNIKVIYAEELFLTIVNRRNDDNFLELENLLGKSADQIVIFLESPGSFVELGAFANHPDLNKKLIVITKSEFKHAESFIEQGPLKMLKAIYKDSVFYIDKVNASTAKEIYSSIKSRGFNKDVTDLTSITSLIYFMPIYLYFLKHTSFYEMRDSIVLLSGRNSEEISAPLKAVFSYLTSNNVIKRIKLVDDFIYQLTDSGYNDTKKLLEVNNFDEYDRNYVDKLRLASMYYSLKYKNRIIRKDAFLVGN